MKKETKLNFGLGSVFSLIVVYFIFLYSRDKGWGVLAFITKWYLIIFGGLFAVSVAVFLLIALSSFALVLMAYFRMRSLRKQRKNKERKYVDVEYEVKE